MLKQVLVRTAAILAVAVGIQLGSAANLLDVRAWAASGGNAEVPPLCDAESSFPKCDVEEGEVCNDDYTWSSGISVKNVVKLNLSLTVCKSKGCIKKTNTERYEDGCRQEKTR
jgi:hypothetical protein